MSAGVVPAGTTRLEPSGSVTVMSLMESCGKGFCESIVRPAFARFASFGAATFAWLANRELAALQPLQARVRAKVGRHGQTRTADLLRVKQAL